MALHTLAELLKDLPAAASEGTSVAVSGVAYRSDTVRPGDAFFCIPGLKHDGHEFAPDAVARGAAALVVAHLVDGLDVPQVVVADVRSALAWASARAFDMPSDHLEVVGVTGTNGKTTTCYLIESIARAGGRSSGLIGTVETRVGDTSIPTTHTTPESRDLQELFARMVEQDVRTVAMEVSSHAIDLHRVDGVHFAVAAFTNLSQDHLDYHRSMDEYLAVKSRLFSELPVQQRVVNIDDPAGERLAAQVGAEWTVGRSEAARVRADGIELGPVSSRFRLVTPRGDADMELPLAGQFNVENALVAAGCGLALGIGLTQIAEGLRTTRQVPGRMERVDEGQDFAVLVDYAHTPDALAKAITAVRDVTPGRVITVFGCGGDRDPEKRPLMGAAAGRLSDVAVVTNDNPRTEDPAGIALQIEAGLQGGPAVVYEELDRRQAIALALSVAQSGDAVLIAGKGHEDYQIFADHTAHFDDRETAREELAAIRGGAPERC